MNYSFLAQITLLSFLLFIAPICGMNEKDLIPQQITPSWQLQGIYTQISQNKMPNMQQFYSEDTNLLPLCSDINQAILLSKSNFKNNKLAESNTWKKVANNLLDTLNEKKNNIYYDTTTKELYTVDIKTIKSILNTNKPSIWSINKIQETLDPICQGKSITLKTKKPHIPAIKTGPPSPAQEETIIPLTAGANKNIGNSVEQLINTIKRQSSNIKVPQGNINTYLNAIQKLKAEKQTDSTDQTIFFYEVACVNLLAKNNELSLDKLQQTFPEQSSSNLITLLKSTEHFNQTYIDTILPRIDSIQTSLSEIHTSSTNQSQQFSKDHFVKFAKALTKLIQLNNLWPVNSDLITAYQQQLKDNAQQQINWLNDMPITYKEKIELAKQYFPPQDQLLLPFLRQLQTESPFTQIITMLDNYQAQQFNPAYPDKTYLTNFAKDLAVIEEQLKKHPNNQSLKNTYQQYKNILDKNIEICMTWIINSSLPRENKLKLAQTYFPPRNPNLKKHYDILEKEILRAKGTVNVPQQEQQSNSLLNSFTQYFKGWQNWF
jgi:hypothetical protein